MKIFERVVMVSAVAAFGIMIIGCSSSNNSSAGGTLTPPDADISGVWNVIDTVTVTSGQCEDEVDSYEIAVTQNGNDITVTSPAGTFTGTLDGSALTWSGSYPEDGGTTTTMINATVTGTSIMGTSTWSWSNGDVSCSGTSSFTATRAGGISGVWNVIDTVTVTSGQDICGNGEVDNYPITVTQNGNDITVASSAGTFSGTLSGSALSWSGSYPEDGGTTTTTINATVSEASITGTSTWSWSDGADSCSGTSSFTATRA